MRHELVAHGTHDGIDVVETRIALARERFLQSLAGHADFGGHVRDPFNAGDDAQISHSVCALPPTPDCAREE